MRGPLIKVKRWRRRRRGRWLGIETQIIRATKTSCRARMSSRTRGQQRRARRPQLEPNPGESAKLLAQFDASDNASFKKVVEMNKIDTGDIDISRPPFKNYIEADWETLNRQDDDVTVCSRQVQRHDPPRRRRRRRP